MSNINTHVHVWTDYKIAAVFSKHLHGFLAFGSSEFKSQLTYYMEWYYENISLLTLAMLSFDWQLGTT